MNAVSDGMQPIISIQNVSKNFGEFVAVDHVSFDIEAGEFFALLGPSGCGKTTLLRMIAGLETPSAGQILLDGDDITQMPANQRPINMVFQSYAVFPHMNVAKNVAYGLKVEGRAASEIDQSVNEILELVQLDQFRTRMPDQLSGGQRQRVALARALVKRPRVLLLDEPLSALDAKLRDAMRLQLVKLQETIGITFIMVTHDQSEALAMTDRIAVIDKGRVRQLARPEVLYDAPSDAFVADFIGKINMFDIDALESKGDQIDASSSELGQIILNGQKPINMEDGGYAFGIRPERVKVSTSEKEAREVKLCGKLGDIAFQGESSLIEIILDQSRSILAFYPHEDAEGFRDLEQGTTVYASWDKDAMLILKKG